MPRKRKFKSTLNVGGLSVQDIMNIDYDTIVKMDEENIKKLASRLVSASNKRIRRLANSQIGQKSPSYKNYLNRGKGFSIRGKDRNEVLSEYSQMIDFLKQKTSTIRGWKDVRNKVLDDINSRFGSNLNHDEANELFDLINEAKSKYPNLADTQGSSDPVQQLIYNWYVDNKNKDFVGPKEKYSDWLKRTMDKLGGESGLSNFFDDGDDYYR